MAIPATNPTSSNGSATDAMHAADAALATLRKTITSATTESKDKVAELQQHIARRDETIAKLRKENTTQARLINRLHTGIRSRDVTLADRAGTIRDLRKENAYQAGLIHSLNTGIKSRDATIASRDATIGPRDTKIINLHCELKVAYETVAWVRKTEDERRAKLEKEVEALKKELQEARATKAE